MKERILKILMDNTSIEGRYVGGGEEPSIVVFNNSEDWDKEEYLSQIADEILNEINQS